MLNTLLGSRFWSLADNGPGTQPIAEDMQMASSWNARMALKFAQRCYVLETGNIVLEGSSSELANNPAVQAAYLGS
ncbi:MAG: hypothetical protein H5T63_08485 [Chloroflexi bacterium]|nr:hypothetical protein [Chloroflexota bacterium]